MWFGKPHNFSRPNLSKKSVVDLFCSANFNGAHHFSRRDNDTIQKLGRRRHNMFREKFREKVISMRTEA